MDAAIAPNTEGMQRYLRIACTEYTCCSETTPCSQRLYRGRTKYRAQEICPSRSSTQMGQKGKRKTKRDPLGIERSQLSAASRSFVGGLCFAIISRASIRIMTDSLPAYSRLLRPIVGRSPCSRDAGAYCGMLLVPGPSGFLIISSLGEG